MAAPSPTPEVTVDGIHPALAAWLRQERPRLNARLRQLRHRFPQVQPGPLLAAVETWLSPFVVADSPAGAASPALLLAVFDLVTLHVARRTLGRFAGVRALLSESLGDPAMRRLAEQDPARFCAAMSNAVERLGPMDDHFVRAMTSCAAHTDSSEALLRAGAVVAWRLGEPRLRRAALRELGDVPAELGLATLALGDWPTEAWPLAVRALQRDAWTHPRAVVSPDLLDQLFDTPDGDVATPAALARPLRDVATTVDAPFERWSTRPPVGDFVGFGGRFARPPRLVALGDRHTLYAEVDSEVWRVDADLFGARCAPCPLDAVPSVGDAAPPAAPVPPAIADALPLLERSARAAGATSLVACEGLVALTLARSHRVQLRVPPTVRV